LSAAFAKINVCVLLEIGLHNPVAVAIARADESEWELSLKLVKKLPPESLLLADRLYGCTAFWQTIVDICQARQGHALVRVRKNVRRNIVQKRKLSDGSRVIEVPVFHPHIQHRVMHYLQLREIRATLARPGKKAIRLRFWTTLLDASVYPAPELVALYARRWGHEVYYRHLKRDLRRTELLKSNTVETACQEIAALLIASSLIAHQRTAAQEADPRLAVTDVSFNLVHQVVRAQWVFAAITADILSPSQLRKISRRAFDIMLPDAVPKKRSRSYPRAVRQPVKGWPRKTMNIVSTTPPVIRILTKWPIC
jgi:hypothetical protein